MDRLHHSPPVLLSVTVSPGLMTRSRARPLPRALEGEENHGMKMLRWIWMAVQGFLAGELVALDTLILIITITSMCSSNLSL